MTKVEISTGEIIISKEEIFYNLPLMIAANSLVFIGCNLDYNIDLSYETVKVIIFQ